MAQGSMQPERLILHPQESLYPLRRPPSPAEDAWAPFHVDDTARMEAIEESFPYLSHTLLAHQHLFDFGDEAILAELGRVDHDGERPWLRVGAMAYPLVIFPALTSVRATTLSLLEDFVGAGGRVLAVGNLPTLVDGRENEAPRLQRFLQQVQEVAPDEIATVLQDMLPPQIVAEVSGPKEWLWQQTRRAGDQQVTLLVNLSRQEAIAGSIEIAETSGSVVQLDLIQQTLRVVIETSTQATRIPLHLAPGESLVLLSGSAPRQLSQRRLWFLRARRAR